MSNFVHSPEDRYFEDYVPGTVHEFGSIDVNEEEVIQFGNRYVPLSYHTDKKAAQASLYGGFDRQWLAHGRADYAQLHGVLFIQGR